MAQVSSVWEISASQMTGILRERSSARYIPKLSVALIKLPKISIGTVFQINSVNLLMQIPLV